ncbi:hypothetical protein Gotur_011510 [Gossypium turneri]
MTIKLMATHTILTMFALLMAAHFKSISSTNLPPKDDQDLRLAMEEMQKANYFTFVMLLNMLPLDPKFLANVTFLMPNDRMLSKTVIPENAVSNFLHRHSIPSPLIFEHLLYIPTGSVLPSLMLEYLMNVSNGGGRRSFVLNNVKIISPNICTIGSSIRCHGIDGVLNPESNISLHTCSNTMVPVPPPPSSVAPPPLLPPPPPSPVPFFSSPEDDFPVPAPLPADSSQHISGSSKLSLGRKVLKSMATILVPLMIGVSI